jgi:hypothetical protein
VGEPGGRDFFCFRRRKKEGGPAQARNPVVITRLGEFAVTDDRKKRERHEILTS